MLEFVKKISINEKLNCLVLNYGLYALTVCMMAVKAIGRKLFASAGLPFVKSACMTDDTCMQELTVIETICE